MDSSTRLQIPDYSPAGPSQTTRTGSSSRPASANVVATLNPPLSQAQNTQASARKRASHNVTTGQQQPPEVPIYRDVYSHPAAVAYAAAHPKRTIPKFGPYLLLQTLGEGEFGKVKLGLHGKWGEEVAVKLIRRGNIDTQVRMSKVEREIEVLRVCLLIMSQSRSTDHTLSPITDNQTPKHRPAL
jgi:protein-serine/threonine kinase